MNGEEHHLTIATRYSIDASFDNYELYSLRDADTDSAVVVCPERGGIVIGCRLHGRELLYLDRETFLHPTANIRGGIPVLFPICGQLVGGQYEWDGQTYGMKNHGVARDRAWRVVATDTREGAALTLALEADEETLGAFPFAFALEFTYRLLDGRLTIEQTYRNDSEQPMPMTAGFHPYFVADNKRLAYETDATRMRDYNDMREKPFDGTLDFGVMVESAALLDARRRDIAFPAAGGQVRMTYSDAFAYVIIWSIIGKPFICVEPWTGLNEALNHRQGLILVESGRPLALELSIAFEPGL